MKKFLIMFVMLLGSVATMQAQSFDFSCVQLSPNAFSGNQMQELSSQGFDDVDGSGNQYSIPSDTYIDITIESLGNGTFLVIDHDGEIEEPFTNLAHAIEYVDILNQGLVVGNIPVGGINFNGVSYQDNDPLIGPIGSTYTIVLSVGTTSDTVSPPDIIYSFSPSTVSNATIEGNVITGVFTAELVRLGVYASSSLTDQAQIFNISFVLGSN